MQEVETAVYVVTERAGRRVAGRFAQAGDELTLTPHEAEFPLITGEIVRKGEKLDVAFARSKTADALRAEARDWYRLADGALVPTTEEEV